MKSGSNHPHTDGFHDETPAVVNLHNNGPGDDLARAVRFSTQ